ncbi:hypothetical protein TSUD_193110 [Trifolium subterraneum]|uniref:Uncharacterized protein n=1 Tax=Trifolium subterraneum TaxID=3900 RepID=A0A2Z6NUA9_TRISU|nr:hypothetical protein TSUD_193110 [Trifolium subterraneum]
MIRLLSSVTTTIQRRRAAKFCSTDDHWPPLDPSACTDKFPFKLIQWWPEVAGMRGMGRGLGKEMEE